MATGIEITDNGKSIIVKSNGYIDFVGSPEVIVDKNDIVRVYLSKDSTTVNVQMMNNRDFVLSTTGTLEGNGSIIVKVESILGVAPTNTQEILNAFKTIKL
jgi:hypothetical protein